jgi:hypothetical protein
MYTHITLGMQKTFSGRAEKARKSRMSPANFGIKTSRMFEEESA